MSYTLHEIEEGLTRIELEGLSECGEALGRGANVYVLGSQGGPVGLVNAGHPAQQDDLLAALHELGISPAQVSRIAVTSWEISAIGGASRFPGADLFVGSPDMQAPRDLEAQTERRRRELLARAGAVAGKEESFSLEAVRAAVRAYYPRVSQALRFIPLRAGHFVNLGGRRFEVLGTPGPGPGHLGLYAAERGYLFSGDFALSGFPEHLENPRNYLMSMERLAELGARWVLPTRGRPFTKGALTLGRAAKFVDNFLGNVTMALGKAPTVLEFIEQDLGRRPDEPVDLVVTHLVFQRLLDELVRTRSIGAEGEGIERRYGVDVDDHRKEIRL